MNMNIRLGFGRLLLRVSEKLKRWSETLTKEVSGRDGTKGSILVWGVVDGPFSRDDFPEEDLYEMDIPDDWNYMLVVQVSEDGKVGSMNMWYDTLDEAYEVCKYFRNNIEPLEIQNE